MQSLGRWLAALVWAVVLAVSLAACFGGPSNGTPSQSRASDGTSSAGSSTATSDGGSSVSNEGSSAAPADSTTTQPQGSAPGQAPASGMEQPGGQLPGPAAPGQAPAAPAPGQVPAPPPGPPAANKPPGEETVVLGWLPIGPVGRGDPVWYVDLKNRNCGTPAEDLASVTTMLELAPTLCLGLNGNQVSWDRGVAVLNSMPAPTLETSDCWSVTAYDVLRNIAAVRAQKPAAMFTLAPRPGTACRPDLEAVEDDGGTAAPTVCAGAALVLVGSLEGLPVGAVRLVSVGGVTVPVRYRERLEDTNYPPGELYFLAPSLPAGSSVAVTVADADYPVDSTATFTYAADTVCSPAPAVSSAPPSSPPPSISSSP